MYMQGGFGQTIEWLTGATDPNIVCHPVVALVIYIVWNGLAPLGWLLCGGQPTLYEPKMGVARVGRPKCTEFSANQDHASTPPLLLRTEL